MRDSYIKKIDFLLSDLNHISFDYDDNSFILSEECNTKEGFINVTTLIEKLRWDKNFRFDVKKTPIDKMNFNYHDSCMQNYCFQIIDEGIRHQHTCWENVTSRRFHLGIWDKNKPFNNKSKERFIKELSVETKNNIINNLHYSILTDFKKHKTKLLDNLVLSNDNWITVQLINPISVNNFKDRQKHNIKKIIKSLTSYRINERVVDISFNISRKQWNQDLGWECPNTVLGFSTKSKEYMNFTGRHRVNAAIYLYKKGIDIGIDHFNYPVIKYNWTDWLHAISPFPNQFKNVKHLCKSCKNLK